MDISIFPERLQKQCIASSFKKIGEGGYGKVYKAYHMPSETWIAIKLINQQLKKNNSGFPMILLREISVLKNNIHPNIIMLLEVIKKLNKRNQVQSYSLIFPLAQCNLLEFIEKNHPIPIGQIKKIMFQISLAIHHLHSRGFLHRDVKPGNVLITKNLNAKLADFGLSKCYSLLLDKLTNQVMTLSYRAPEMLLGQQAYTTAADIWSLGCTFYRLSQRQHMFFSDCQIGLLFQIMKIRGTPKLEQWPQVKNIPHFKPTFPKFQPQQIRFTYLPPKGQDLINQMTRFNPAKRLSANDILNHQFFHEPLFTPMSNPQQQEIETICSVSQSTPMQQEPTPEFFFCDCSKLNDCSD